MVSACITLHHKTVEATDWLQHHVNDVYDVIAAGPAGNIIVAGDLAVNKGFLYQCKHVDNFLFKHWTTYLMELEKKVCFIKKTAQSCP